MISDSFGRVWRRRRQQPSLPTAMSLYADYHRAAWVIHEMLVAEYRVLPTFDFEVPIKIKIYSAAPLDEKVVGA